MARLRSPQAGSTALATGWFDYAHHKRLKGVVRGDFIDIVVSLSNHSERGIDEPRNRRRSLEVWNSVRLPSTRARAESSSRPKP